jgi:hypothetical protein
MRRIHLKLIQTVPLDSGRERVRCVLCFGN